MNNKPLISHIYTADPSAHVFEGRIYIYPSHDLDHGGVESFEGDQYQMEDYHVLSMDRVGGETRDHGQVLHVKDVPWAKSQMWAPDAAYRDGRYYLFFPARDPQGIFRIGVASSDQPDGPFQPEAQPITGTYSIDPCVFEDEGSHYLGFGGLWGGQLQCWTNGTFDGDAPNHADDRPAICAKIARLEPSMKNLAEPLRDIVILDEKGQPVKASDNKRRFFEGPWIHRYRGTYYFSYSTGDTHTISYATADNVYGPYIYRGVILNPVIGWTTHHSIVEFEGRWYLFYHDSSLSGGKSHLRCVKVHELKYRDDGSIVTIDP